MARAALENAVWDLLACAQGAPLCRMLGGQCQQAPVGVSVGIEPTLDQLHDRVAGYVEQGYRRVELKIKPGWDVDAARCGPCASAGPIRAAPAGGCQLSLCTGRRAGFCAQPRLDAQRAAGARSGRHPRSVPDQLSAARQRVHTIGIATR